ncbi:MAG: hypothetical protein EXX96DRAFT_571284 [Benjaminiella poitrasii]|nr:MAG: hypothetical protein EXX96DRAFT_571284 [Benjaminiella poitrasii]
MTSFLSYPKTYQILTKIQNASAITFSTFTVVHVSQLLVANVGGVESANRWLILGRPFYQDAHLEGLVVTGAGLVHVAAGLGKWLIRRLYWPRSSTKRQNLTGYVLIPLAGLHYYLVRTLPQQQYGDSSFIDFGYVAWGLQNRPWFTYSLHIALILTGSYHVVAGISQLWNRQKSSKRRRIVQGGVIAGLCLGLTSSLFIIGRETKKIPLRLDFENMYRRISI